MFVVGFSRGSSCLARAIRWLTRSSWAHVWIEYESSDWGGRWMAHATERGVVKELAEPRLKRWRPEVTRFEVMADMTPGLRLCREYEGCRCGWLAVLRHALKICSNWLSGQKCIGTAPGAASLTCSDFAGAVLQNTPLDEMKGLNVGALTPIDLDLICSASKNFRVIEERGRAVGRLS